MTPALATRSIHKTYGHNRVLQGVDLIVEPGEWVALMGPSGCGKSTLLNLIAGLDAPDSGSISVAGHRMDTLNTNARAVLRRETIGIVFQSFNLIPSLTVRENVALPQRLAGQTRKSADARTSELLKGLGLHDFQNAAVTTLSGGQQQRVAMARAVANRPAVLLADEPTGSLDTEASANVIGLLKQEHQRGQTIVMVTHDYSVASAADRIVRLRDGLVVDDEHIEPHPADLYIDELVGRTTPSAFERLVSFE